MKQKTIGMYGGKFLPLHQGHVFLITQAACQVDELYVVLSYSEKRDEALVKQGNIKPLPYTLRLRWLSQLTKDMENVTLIAVEDDAIDDETYDWRDGAMKIQEQIGKKVDLIFGSETHYKDIFESLYPGSHYVCIDPNRTFYPISATKIRNEGVFKHWEFIPDVAKPYFVKTVMVVGTESCGKSTLTKYLANVFNTTFVEEYGRTYTENLGRSLDILTIDDFHQIAYGQKLQEKAKKEQANKLLFIDTEAAITQYYAGLYIKEKSPVLNAIINTEQYDLRLFLEPDVPWVDDGNRDFGDADLRKQNNKALKSLLTQHNIPFITLSGDYHKRLMGAVEEVKKLVTL